MLCATECAHGLAHIDPTFWKSLNDGASPMTACERLQTRLQTEPHAWLITGLAGSPPSASTPATESTASSASGK